MPLVDGGDLVQSLHPLPEVGVRGVRCPADAEDRGLLLLSLGHQPPEGPVVALVDGVRLDGLLGGFPLAREGDVVQFAPVLAGEPFVLVVVQVRGPRVGELPVVRVESGALNPVQLMRFVEEGELVRGAAVGVQEVAALVGVGVVADRFGP